MCLGKPKVQAAPTQMIAPPVETTSAAALDARNRERRRRSSAYGQPSTILTGAQGAPVTAQQKTLLGS